MNPAPVSEPTDKELVARAARGDESAFGVLFERKHRRVYLIAYRILGDAAAAEDVVQESFLALWRNCARYRARYAVDAWLGRIATNRAIDAYRRRARNPRPLGRRAREAEDGSPADPVEHMVQPGTRGDASLPARWRQLQRLWDELASELPPQQRAAFSLREIEGLSTGEVARALGCSASSVRSHVALARKTLKAQLARRRLDL